MTTPDFGAAWGTLAVEKQVMVSAPTITTTDAYKHAIGTKLGVHVVDTI